MGFVFMSFGAALSLALAAAKNDLLRRESQVQLKTEVPKSHDDACVPPGMHIITNKAAHHGLGIKMVGLNNDIVSNQIENSGTWEVSSTAEMAAKANTTIPKKGVFLDIGSNLGYYSLMFASEGHRVIAVEPMTRNRKALEASLCLNPHLKHLISIVPVALVATDELENTGKNCVVGSPDPQNIGDGILNCSKDAACLEGTRNCEEVPVKTLDMLLEELAPATIDIVKMDIEGHECSVLKGGSSLFQKFHPSLFQVETFFGRNTDDPHASGKCLAKFAKEYKYNSYEEGSDTRLSFLELGEALELGETRKHTVFLLP